MSRTKVPMATDEQTPPEQERKDFFISYTNKDQAWAEWIAWQLENMGYRTVLQIWDFHAGSNFVLDMDIAIKQAERIIAILSPEYFTSKFTSSEWAAAFRRDPKGEQGLLIPVRVRLCDVEGLLGQIVYVDLVDRTEQEALAVLQAEVQRRRRKPLHAPIFPHHPSIPRPDHFPGVPGPVQHIDPDWERMLKRLQGSYNSLLNDSLHGIAWIELGLSTQPDLVRNITNLLFRFSQGERLLAPGTRILDAYDEAMGELLILGAPGAGKSTLLLDLARELVSRAQASEIYRLPVILRLSSWATGRSELADWMEKELVQTYDIPPQVSKRWVRNGRLLPLLDGLDEIEEAARPACIAAINSYHRTHWGAPLVVCSRQAEYEMAAKRERLALQSAVIIQSLSDEQIEDYLHIMGPSFANVRAALSQNQALREMAATPLMLSVILLTYRDDSTNDIIRQEADLERRVWTDYVSRMVSEKGQVSEKDDTMHYPLQRTCAWLTFLAQQLRKHQQVIFYAEYLDAQWLAGPQQRTLALLTGLIPSLVIGICVSLLISVFILLTLLPTSDSIVVLQMGVLGGFVGVSLNPLIVKKLTASGRRLQTRTARHLRNAVLLGALLAASCGLYLRPVYLDQGYLLSDWLRDGCILGLGSLLSGWIFQRCVDHQVEQRTPLPSTRRRWRSRLVTWMNMLESLPHWRAVALLGIGIGLSFGLSFGLSYSLHEGLSMWLSLSYYWEEGLRHGLSFGLKSGLSVMLCCALVDFVLAASLRTLRFAERISWTWQRLFRRDHLRTAGTIAAMTFLFYGLSNGLSSFYGLSNGWSFGLDNPLRAGLGSGLINGLRIGLVFGLAYWLLLGLYQGMQQEHLDDENRVQFNQGIRRSLRNGLLVSLLSTFIIGTMSMLSETLNNLLSNGLGDLQYFLPLSSSQLSDALIVLVSGMVVMWALSGGPTVLRHYVIRWLLYSHGTFPFRAQAFLEDATTRILLRRVGGGYSFIHRRLQDYFADAAVLPLQE